MTPERWQQIEQVFQAAIELPVEERQAFVERACAGDVELRREVESMIAADEQGLSLVEAPALELAARFVEAGKPELAEGQFLGHYEVIELLGLGGMGEVYLARDKRLNRRVALKLLPGDYTRNKDRLRRFQREAQAASALNHPNILTIHELGEVDGQHFIATEFVEGETLRQRMRRERLSLGEALEIAVQTAGALAAAHKAGIVHRDIKPENIMVRPDGYVKVLDFGLAKLTEQTESTTDVQAVDDVNISSGLVMGTVRYMSPEQAQGLSVDSRSDIFSLGVVLYEMIAGRVPFEGGNAPEVVAAILTKVPPLLTEHPQDDAEYLDQIVGNALRKQKERRYQTAEQLLIDLKKLRQASEPASRSQPHFRKSDGGGPATEEQWQERTSTIEYLVSQVRQHKPATTTAFVGLAILLGGVWYPLREWLDTQVTPANELKTTMLTMTGHVMEPAISPDGKYVAYRTEDAGLFSLRVKELETNNDIEVTPPEERAVLNPVFTPDDKSLYYEFLADDPPPELPRFTRQLYRQPVLGGSAERIVDYLHSEVTFSPKGEKLAFIRNARGGNSLIVANADGTDESAIISLKEPDYFPEALGRSLSWSPDGKHIAYVAQMASDGFQRIFDVDLDSKLTKPLTFQKWGHGVVSPCWLPDSSGIVFIAATSSIWNAIWHLSYPGGNLRRITKDASKYSGLSVAGDSSTLLTIGAADYMELWLAPDADASRAKRIMPGRHDGRYGFNWTPTGQVVYSRETNDNGDIWIANVDGTSQKQLTTDVNQDKLPTVTGDGRHIVFQSNRSGADHIWRMDIDGENQKQLTFGRMERDPSCSPDSKWVVYTAWETGKATPWKIPVEGGTAQQITDVPCGRPVVSHSGKLVACGMNGRVLIVPFEGGDPVATIQVPQGAAWDGSWTLDDRAIRYAISNRNQNYQIYGVANWWIQPIDGGRPQQLTFFKPDQIGATPRVDGAWSPDGKDLLYVRFELKSDLVIITGFK